MNDQKEQTERNRVIEECAKVCDARARLHEEMRDRHAEYPDRPSELGRMYNAEMMTAEACAASIRALASDRLNAMKTSKPDGQAVPVEQQGKP